MDFERIEFKKKDNLIKQVANMYRSCELHTDICGVFQVGDQVSHYFEVKHQVDCALRKLCDYQIQIIRKEYLGHYRKNWYIEFYDDATFYECKERSMNAFLHALYG
ncbi:MG284/MPN403 family protein [Breznakia pachnodae]|uniref:Alpha-1,6-mannanase (GH76 family) n=1 Tax=Breznakia pachnodae TaxID=265178 RepID=A0ABU0DYV4_9FIRM|nr:hypothetical protein [Breznakia pachnodae]MDQ0359715.1 putative alpha-1,6-mannanase (GH76 family) [Breznakia pachnodae]